MQNPQITSSVYFPKQSYLSKYKGFQEMKQQKFHSPQERKFKEWNQKNNQTSDFEETIVITNSAKQIISKRRITFENQINSDEESYFQKNEGSLSHRYLANSQMLKQQKQLLPSLPCQTNLNYIKPQARQLFAKPFIKKQKSLDHVVQICYSNKQFAQLKEGASLKCLFKTLVFKEENYDKILIIQFENLLLKRSCSFWENQNEVTNCGINLGTNNQEQCENSYCICNLRREFKNTLKILSKAFIIIFLVQNANFMIKWHKYLQEQNYYYDALYQIRIAKDVHIGGIQLNKVFNDFQKFKLSKIIYFDSIDISNSSKLHPEDLQYKIPITNFNLETSIFLFKKNIQQKQFDSNLLYNLSMAFFQGKEHVISKKQVYFENIDLHFVFEYYSSQNQIKKTIQLRKLNELKQKYQSILHTLNQSQNIQIEKDEYLIQWISATRNDFINDFKMKKNERVPQFYFTIGDVIVRNQKLKWQHFSYKSEKLQIGYEHLCKQITKLNQDHENFEKHQHSIKINCILCIE
ncbi:unnamed protein product (macronuclear) [Paramecium tetraurelia]|uniref:Uncharacterized protein n=1 Tax=Paramecium tetraurelia TaxID=5888 RepID=A0CIK1_PARTE|nr:uncharacterized protein GSPATT00007753001 [Paramecium tetraurelia]CAK70618.1 unnamed protein product [Paramecium tetraurelia]|eukprot:XP_001438015.1 hypothetical protein (macronuclear) [Paramecium tetraurelia strain d4-2]